MLPMENSARAALASNMTPAEFKEARHKLGLSANKCAKLFKVSDGRTIRRWESGERDIPGPAQVLMRWLVTGRKPQN